MEMGGRALSFFVTGTDTGAGKTTFSLLWSHAFFREWGYFKPVETGDSDSQKLKALGHPNLRLHPPIARFGAPQAPHRAASEEGRCIPSLEAAVEAIPHEATLVEGFGGAFSPWDHQHLCLDFAIRGRLPAVLVGSTELGGVGRILGQCRAMSAAGVPPKVLVVIGSDSWTRDQIALHEPGIPVYRLEAPLNWDRDGLEACAQSQKETLTAIAAHLREPSQPDGPTLVERDRQSVWHPYVPIRQRETPLAVRASLGDSLLLEDGRWVVDAIASWWTILYGHQGLQMGDFVARHGSGMDHVQFAGLTHAPAVELAELLLDSALMKGGRVFYSDNGSTAIEVALKIAWMHWRKKGQPNRDLFVGFENGYHGDTFATMAIARHPLFTRGFEPLMFEAKKVPVSPQALEALLRSHPGRVAGVILEPLVQGAAGMVMHSPETLGQIIEICRRYDTLFIADEVMTGGGRTGTIWAHQHALKPGDHPDLIAAGKTLSGGLLPLAATLVSPELVESLDSDDPEEALFHGHSFTAHPLACSLGVAAWKRLTQNGPREAMELQRYWKTHLEPLQTHPSVREVRILGAIAAVELALPPGYISPVRARAVPIGLEHGVLWRPLGNVLYALPPLDLTPQGAEKIFRAFFATVEAFATA